MTGIEWGPVAAWAGAIATVLVVITTSLVALGFFDRFRSPRLRVTFASTEPWLRRGPVGDGGDGEWVRVGIENVGKTAAIGCIGRVSEVRTDGRLRPDVDPVQLRWAGVPRSRGFEPIDLRPGQREFLNVILRRGDGLWHFATFESADFDRAFTTALAEAEHHEIRIEVYADNARVAAVLTADGSGTSGSPAAIGARQTDEYLASAGGSTPVFSEEELQIIASPLDFIGINVYKPGWYVEPSDDAPGYRDIPINASHPKMLAAWHILDPEVMYWAPRQMQSIWGAQSIYITENGCGASDVVADDGRVYDSDRVMFLRASLGQLQRATAEGVPVHGYFHWSAQDNFEWMDGYGTRFGLIYVDFDTLERTPKLSAEWFREAARRNAVV